MFTAGSVKPPPRHPKVFAVCPHSLPAELEQEMMTDSSFKVVHPSCRVTMQWMEVCTLVRRSAVCAAHAQHPRTACGGRASACSWDVLTRFCRCCSTCCGDSKVKFRLCHAMVGA